MTQQQVKMRKKELEQSLDQFLNPLKNIIEKMERDLGLNQNFFTKMSFTNKKKFLKRQLKNDIVRRITVQ